MTRAFMAPPGTGRRRLNETGLVVTYHSEGAPEETRISLAEWSGAHELLMQIASGLRRYAGPGGTGKAVSTVEGRVNMARRFAAWCAARGIDSIADFSLAQYNDWLLFAQSDAAATGTKADRIGSVRLLLRNIPELRPEVRSRLGHPLPTGGGVEVPTIPIEDFERIRIAAQRVVRDAWVRIGENARWLREVSEGRAELGEEDRLRFEALSAIARGDLPQGIEQYGAIGCLSDRYPPSWNGLKQSVRQVLKARSQLFLLADEAYAAAVLQVCLDGSNASVIRTRPALRSSPGLGDEEEIYSFLHDKPRSGPRRYEPDLVVKRVALWLGRISEATEPARQNLASQGRAADVLLAYWGRFGVVSGIPHKSVQVYDSWWPEGLSRPSFRVLRKTFVVHLVPEPSGHTRETWERDYLAADETARESLREVASAAFESLIAEIEEAVRLRISTTPVSPENDTLLAACDDFEHHPDTGTTCEDSLWNCLFCPNAVAEARHFPRLIALKMAFDEMASTGSDAWVTKHARHYAAVCALIARIGPAAAATASLLVTESVRADIDLLLTEAS